MIRFLNSWDSLKWGKVFIPAGGGVLLAVLFSIVGPKWWGGLDEQIAAIKDTTAFGQEPIYVGKLELEENSRPLHPYALYLSSDYLYVSYLNTDRVDLFDNLFNHVKTLRLSHGDPASITGIAADDRYIYVADFKKGEIRFHDHQAKVIQAFNWLPNKAGRLRPHGLHLNQGNLYVTDIEQQQLLVISVSDAEGLTETGELLFSVPGPSSDTTVFHCPTGVTVTKDGRILVTDMVHQDVKVLSCNGRFSYRFENENEARLLGPNGIAFDHLSSPGLLALADSVFNPSQIYSQGRIHVVDTKLGRVKVYTSVGEYILTYGKGLKEPNGIAIDRLRRLIIIADTRKSVLVVYKY